MYLYYISIGQICLILYFLSLCRTQKRQQTFFDGEATSPPGICHLPMAEPFCPRTRKVQEKAESEIALYTMCIYICNQHDPNQCKISKHTLYVKVCGFSIHYFDCFRFYIAVQKSLVSPAMRMGQF